MIRKQLVGNLRPISMVVTSRQSVVNYGALFKFSNRENKLTAPNLVYCNQLRPMSGDIQRQAKSALQKAEKFTFIFLAKTVHFAKVVQESNEYNIAKENLKKLYLWALRSFQKYIIDNPKIQRAFKSFKGKLEDASKNEDFKRKK